MRVTFLAHNGFFIELDQVCLLFDWWKGVLPPLPDKPLLVFVSHRHEDHFNPAVFTLADRKADIQFLLGSDFHLTPHNLTKWQLSPETAAKCRRCGKHDTFAPLPGVTVETFPSTDEGVAWMVTVNGQSIFHAGDLNWWHWAEEDLAWNRNMEANFKRYTEPLRGRRVDLAMLPLDSRLKTGGYLGPNYFLNLMEVRRFLPMHQWEDFAFTDEFLSAYPQVLQVDFLMRHIEVAAHDHGLRMRNLIGLRARKLSDAHMSLARPLRLHGHARRNHAGLKPLAEITNRIVPGHTMVYTSQAILRVRRIHINEPKPGELQRHNAPLGIKLGHSQTVKRAQRLATRKNCSA